MSRVRGQPARTVLRGRRRQRAAATRQALDVAGIRRTRYRGLPKVRLQHAFSATALNVIRLDAHWTTDPLDPGALSDWDWSGSPEPSETVPARTSSPIPSVLEQLGSPTDSLTSSDVADLRRFLILVADPRDVRGLRYPAVALLCAAVSAVLTGARSLSAISE